MIGGALPPTPAKQLKFWVDIPFRNSVEVGSGRTISIPDHKQKCSPRMIKEVSDVKHSVYGKKANHVTLDNYRICWYVIKSQQENFSNLTVQGRCDT